MFFVTYLYWPSTLLLKIGQSGQKLENITNVKKEITNKDILEATVVDVNEIGLEYPFSSNSRQDEVDNCKQVINLNVFIILII